MRAFIFFLFVAVFFSTGSLRAADAFPESLPWESTLTPDSPLTLTLLPPFHKTGSPTSPDAVPRAPVVFYLKNLPASRIGTDSDDDIIRDLRQTGHLVIVLDYEKNPRARLPWINRDLGKLRDDLHSGSLLGKAPIDHTRVYIVPSGHRLKRDIVFHRDDNRTLALDLIYPSGSPENPARLVTGTVLEFSCDNKNRFGNASLSICSDTLLDGFATEGFAVAMADHPVAPPYKGLDPMPSSAQKIKSAVRVLRAETASLGLSDRIVPVGFSRGSGMALMLLSTENSSDIPQVGPHLDTSSAVQGAVILSGRFTYTNLLPKDPMIPRYDKAWGTFASAPLVWQNHGALDHLNAATHPVFLSINITESPDALHQMVVLRKRLAELGNDAIFMMEREPRAHKVPLAPAILEAMRDYLKRQLSPAGK